jgi:hypothetical protein
VITILASQIKPKHCRGLPDTDESMPRGKNSASGSAIREINPEVALEFFFNRLRLVEGRLRLLDV